MEVIIDGVEFVPKNSFGVEAHGVEYSSIEHWLYNIQCILTNRWVSTLKENHIPCEDPEAVKLYNRVKEFQKFAEELLGYKDMEQGYGYKPIEGWTISDYGKIKED